MGLKFAASAHVQQSAQYLTGTSANNYELIKILCRIIQFILFLNKKLQLAVK